MRQSIDGDPRALKDVLRRNDIRTSFLGGASGSDAKVVAAFVKTNGDNALKTKPKVSQDFQFVVLPASVSYRDECLVVCVRDQTQHDALVDLL